MIFFYSFLNNELKSKQLNKQANKVMGQGLLWLVPVVVFFVEDSFMQSTVWM